MTIKINGIKVKKVSGTNFLLMGLVTGQAKPQCAIPQCLNTELPFMFPVYAEIPPPPHRNHIKSA